MTLFKLITILTCLAIFVPLLASADGGMIIWPPDVDLDQQAQNAIVAWNGNQEIIILSNDIKSDASSTALRIVPLPSEPEIKPGSFESFEVLVEMMNKKLEAMQGPPGVGKEGGPPEGVEITFQKKIGAHDLTVVKVTASKEFVEWIEDFAEQKNLHAKQLSDEFKAGVRSYLKRDINYFVFDVITVNPVRKNGASNGVRAEKSIKPLIYEFESDYLFYPISITGFSEVGTSRAEINLFLITSNQAKISDVPYSYYRSHWFSNYGYPVELNQSELTEVSEEIADLFENGVKVRKTSLYGKLNEITRDLMIHPYSWDKDLTIGSRGRPVKALQKMLINEGVWDSEVEATGYFGPITKQALIKFQERYKQDILEPIDLEQGTGYFGKKTRNYLKQLSITGVQPELKIEWGRNLGVGMRGDDVKKLQKILIEEEVWNSGVEPTGYFGPITKAAVIRFQEKHSDQILEPLELKKGTGFVGPSTRSYLKTKDLEGKTPPGEKDLTYCEADSDCVLVNSNCCPCSMGGGKKCINKDYQAQWIQKLNCDEKRGQIICPAVYLCDDLPTKCQCLNNTCHTASE